MMKSVFASLALLAMSSPAWAEPDRAAASIEDAAAPESDGPAKADRPAVGILRIETAGVPEAAASQMQAEVIEGLGAVGLSIIPREALLESLGDADFADGCTFGPCLRPLHDLAKVDLVLVARISQVGTSYQFVVSLVDTRSGFPTSQVSQACPVCTVDEAISTATLATVALVTGTGDAEVTDPSGDPTARVEVGKDVERSKKVLRRAGLVFLGAGAVVTVFGAYFLADDQDALGAVGLTTGGALLAGGTTMLVLSRRF